MSSIRRVVYQVLLVSSFLTTSAQKGSTPVAERVVSGGKLIVKVAPVYPVVAEETRMEGVVLLNALIGVDGHIQHLEVRSGPVVFHTAALDAVKRWVYEPFLLNGEASPVATTISIRFSRDTQPQVLASGETQREQLSANHNLPAPEPNRPRISSAVLMASLVKKVEPVYPSGVTPGNTVVLRVFVGKDGRVSEVTPVSGAEPLSTPAIRAVQQWEFQPYLLNGEPTAFETVLTLRPR